MQREYEDWNGGSQSLKRLLYGERDGVSFSCCPYGRTPRRCLLGTLRWTAAGVVRRMAISAVLDDEMKGFRRCGTRWLSMDCGRCRQCQQKSSAR